MCRAPDPSHPHPARRRSTPPGRAWAPCRTIWIGPRPRRSSGSADPLERRRPDLGELPFGERTWSAVRALVRLEALVVAAYGSTDVSDRERLAVYRDAASRKLLDADALGAADAGRLLAERATRHRRPPP
jgi:hypothetical protein